MLPQYWSRGGYCLTDVEECKLLALATIVAPSVGLTQLKLKIQREREGGVVVQRNMYVNSKLLHTR